MINFLKNNLLFRDGKYIFATNLILIILSFLFFKIALFILIPFFAFCLYFFRNPDRDFEINEKNIISPADGKIVEITQINVDNYSQKISIFLSPFDVHVNWIPVEGKITEINYKPGKFVVAFAPKSSDINERNDIIINNKNGKILVRQIAGFVARRICCWVKKDQNIQQGQKFGMIRFGSRIDIFLPGNIEILVNCGQKVIGGQTILGKWK